MSTTLMRNGGALGIYTAYVYLVSRCGGARKLERRAVLATYAIISVVTQKSGE